MDTDRIIYLFNKNRERNATDDEFEEFKNLLFDHQAIAILSNYWDQEWKTLADHEIADVDFKRLFNELLIIPERQKPNNKYLWLKWAAAITIILALGLGTHQYFNFSVKHNNKEDITSVQKDIPPGRNGATLMLANGHKINLSGVKSGPLASEAGIRITKSADGQVVYTVIDQSKEVTGTSGTNTLSTTNGQQYRVRLPDSTEVWLNAGSTLKYPVSFMSLKERRVKLSGEAYLEVAKDKSHPFIVETSQQEVKVLGTHFNIMAYSNESITSTTLLEGSVHVIRNGSERILKPGQQFRVSGSGLSVTEVNVDEAIAWKNGYFIFNEDLRSIMNKISRWYDVDVDYGADANINDVFEGKIARSRNLSEVLQVMQYTGLVHFKIQGRRITVRK